MHMSLPGVELIGSLDFKQCPVTAEFSGLNRLRQSFLLALLNRQRMTCIRTLAAIFSDTLQAGTD